MGYMWQVKSYLVMRSEWNNFQASIKTWNSEQFKLKLKLEVENDPDKRAVLSYKILSIDRKIAAIKSQLSEILVEVGVPAELRFEVL